MATVHHTINVNSNKATCGITTQNYTTNPEHVTCKRCLKVLESLNSTDEAVEALPLLNNTTEELRPATKPATKPATIHYHDIDRHPIYQTWCKIPGSHSPDAADVTCKVCRAHLDGKAPLNAVPERVKAARKSFRSFVARVAYMVYMDADCMVAGEWSIKHTNMAGTCYEVSWSQTLGYRVMEDGEITITDMGKDIKVWMEDNWSCGEDK